MHRAFEVKIHLPYQHYAYVITIYLFIQRMGQQSVQRQSSDFTYELRDEHKAEANIVVAIVRIVPVTIRGTTILSIIVPATAAYNTVQTLD